MRTGRVCVKATDRDDDGHTTALGSILAARPGRQFSTADEILREDEGQWLAFIESRHAQNMGREPQPAGTAGQGGRVARRHHRRWPDPAALLPLSERCWSQRMTSGMSSTAARGSACSDVHSPSEASPPCPDPVKAQAVAQPALIAS